MSAASADPTLRVARILVFVAGERSGSDGARRRDPTSAGASRDTLAALGRLGGEIELELVRDVAGCLEATRSGRVDLVLLDRVAGGEARRVLDELREEGPPIVVVTPESGGRDALEAARDGAAESVRAGPDYGEVLPVVVLEQLRRSASARVGAAPRRAQDLKRYADGIVEDLPCALVVLDAEGCILAANDTAFELLGGAGNEIAGRRIWEWLDGDSVASSLIGRVLDQGIRFRGVEALLRRDDERVLPVGLACSPRVVEGHVATRRAGKIGHGAVLVFQDLSAIKGLERQLLQSEKMASIGLLAAGIAHEINNPVGFIHANLFQMNEYLADLRQGWACVDALQTAVRAGDLRSIRAASDALAEKARELDLDFVQQDFVKAVRESQDGAERIRNIVRDLRDFSRNDSDSFEYSDLNQCLEATVGIASTMIKHSAALEKHYSSLPKVRCCPVQLRQVFLNLLLNAQQAVEERHAGTGGLGTIEIRSECRDDHAVISIRDSGAGVAPADLPRLFDPFFTTREVGAGSGLGLAVCYSIVRRHGGRIEVSSELGQGTTFEVWLPISSPDEETG